MTSFVPAAVVTFIVLTGATARGRTVVLLAIILMSILLFVVRSSWGYEGGGKGISGGKGWRIMHVSGKGIK